MKIKTGNVDQAKTVRAGCGMRYDPEQLGEDTGFDFPGSDLWQSLFADKEETASNREDAKSLKNKGV